MAFGCKSRRLLKTHDICPRSADDLGGLVKRLVSCITSVPEVEAHDPNGFRHGLCLASFDEKCHAKNSQ
jgi:hypothetical protein